MNNTSINGKPILTLMYWQDKDMGSYETCQCTDVTKYRNIL